MRTDVLPWLLALTLPVLAGCLGDGAPDGEAFQPYGVSAAGLESGHAYAFAHEGGMLAIALDGDGSAVAVLYDPQDRRLGVLELGADAFRRDVALDGLPAGDYVLQVTLLNATLEVRSDGDAVDEFKELGSHFERVVLVDRPVESDATLGLVPAIGIETDAEPVDTSMNLTLGRTPTLLRLYAAGSGQDAHVQVRGSAGTVLAFDDDYGDPGAPSDPELEPLGADFFPFNVRDRSFDVRVQAADMDGVLVLEAWSYSRLVPAPAVEASHVALSDMPFTYGAVPSRPVLFQVHDGAASLYAWSDLEDPRFADGWDEDEQGPSRNGTTNGTANGTASPAQEETQRDEGPVPWIVVFGPDDERLGAYPVPAGHVVRIPIDTGGDYVAVSKHGDVYLGADRAPINFQLSVLDVQESVLPADPAGSTEAYEQRTGTTDVGGIPYGVRPTMADPEEQEQALPTPQDLVQSGCSDPGTVRVLAGNETLGFVRPDSQSDVARLDLHVDTGLTFIQDGLGGSCGHMAFAVMSYVR